MIWPVVGWWVCECRRVKVEVEAEEALEGVSEASDDAGVDGKWG